MKKYLCFMLIALIAVSVFVSCKAEPEHVHNYIAVEGKEATCTESGYSSYVACECGEKLGYNVIPAAHKYDAICADGHTICSGCGKNHNPAIKIENYDAKQADWSFVDGKTILIASCGCATENFTVEIGSVGPAGGFIVYDVDADNDAATNDGLVSAELGWRFIEAAPADLGKVDDAFSFDSDDDGYSVYTLKQGRRMEMIDGVLRQVFLNGTSTRDDQTKSEIGYGKANTEYIADTLSSLPVVYGGFDAIDSSQPITEYASKVISDLKVGEFDDWYIPSKDELAKMFEMQALLGMSVDPSQNYWSSTEGPFSANFYGIECNTGNMNPYRAAYAFRIRPVRYF